MTIHMDILASGIYGLMPHTSVRLVSTGTMTIQKKLIKNESEKILDTGIIHDSTRYDDASENLVYRFAIIVSLSSSTPSATAIQNGPSHGDEHPVSSVPAGKIDDPNRKFMFPCNSCYLRIWGR
ncbi:hypothetical protein IAQ61_007512 [Plenodomus lingam]|uniref:uncharacterized protein n=1 Tax=Leptosphaeria maculans TaxID=5022 RepID=UPI00333019C0|nr:hypothetical protein IAQ61_007512 [Plenodomus lingam]